MPGRRRAGAGRSTTATTSRGTAPPRRRPTRAPRPRARPSRPSRSTRRRAPGRSAERAEPVPQALGRRGTCRPRRGCPPWAPRPPRGCGPRAGRPARPRPRTARRRARRAADPSQRGRVVGVDRRQRAGPQDDVARLGRHRAGLERQARRRPRVEAAVEQAHVAQPGPAQQPPRARGGRAAARVVGDDRPSSRTPQRRAAASRSATSGSGCRPSCGARRARRARCRGRRTPRRAGAPRGTARGRRCGPAPSARRAARAARRRRARPARRQGVDQHVVARSRRFLPSPAGPAASSRRPCSPAGSTRGACRAARSRALVQAQRGLVVHAHLQQHRRGPELAARATSVVEHHVARRPAPGSARRCRWS